MEREQLAQFMETIILGEYLTHEDLLPLIRVSTSRMLKEPESKIFKEPSQQDTKSPVEPIEELGWTTDAFDNGGDNSLAKPLILLANKIDQVIQAINRLNKK